MRHWSLTGILFFVLLDGLSQVQVREEPRHHWVFENNFIRILDVWLPPGDTTLYHVHNTPSVFITFTQTITGAQLLGEQPGRGSSTKNNIWYESLDTPRIHRVWNEDNTWFHVMDIELTAGTPKSTPPFRLSAPFHFLFSQPQANGYKFSLPVGSRIEIPASVSGYLLLSLDEATIELQSQSSTQIRLMRAAHYQWIEAGSSLTVFALNRSCNFFLLQVK